MQSVSVVSPHLWQSAHFWLSFQRIWPYVVISAQPGAWQTHVFVPVSYIVLINVGNAHVYRLSAYLKNSCVNGGLELNSMDSLKLHGQPTMPGEAAAFLKNLSLGWLLMHYGISTGCCWMEKKGYLHLQVLVRGHRLQVKTKHQLFAFSLSEDEQPQICTVKAVVGNMQVHLSQLQDLISSAERNSPCRWRADFLQMKVAKPRVPI